MSDFKSWKRKVKYNNTRQKNILLESFFSFMFWTLPVFIFIKTPYYILIKLPFSLLSSIYNSIKSRFVKSDN